MSVTAHFLYIKRPKITRMMGGGSVTLNLFNHNKQLHILPLFKTI